MKYFANFQIVGGSLFRFDTRIYLDAQAQPTSDDVCIAAIIGKNPGSATISAEDYGQLAELDLGRDMMLRVVSGSFRRAFALAGKQPRSNQYVAVWNLFYLCNKDFHQAIRAYRTMPCSLHCNSEKKLNPPIVWYAWGAASGKCLKDLNTLKERFHGRSFMTPFFFDHATHSVQAKAPELSDLARYPLMLPMAPIDRFIADYI